jgi:hypothetical protein
VSDHCTGKPSSRSSIEQSNCWLSTAYEDAASSAHSDGDGCQRGRAAGKSLLLVKLSTIPPNGEIDAVAYADAFAEDYGTQPRSSGPSSAARVGDDGASR